MQSLCWLFLTVLCCIIKTMDGLCPNLYFSAFRKYVYNTHLWIYKEISIPNDLTTDFMNLSNWMLCLQPVVF